ncbi:MAG TPA: UDP-N-acetylmuramoyl-L-alanine--D-glutamate ligase [Candidatus Sulfopaludibacter sp.]|jgi:UDP-N-acetylmuramoylalanine--D-glutamate ligase|nr:UDP-N-acetylmuramoyl-L-alanine--D-glutamate ligase [Candidatus Sulfopaludibacter sp.]
MPLNGTRALVVGMKKSGMAMAEFLSRQGALVRATDLKPLADLPGAADLLERLHIPFAPQSAQVFEDCDLIALSPDVPWDLPLLTAARARGVRVTGEVELAAPLLKGRTIGITGSNGKTTTTSLIGHILREAGVPVQVGGNIGTPVTAMLDNSRDDGWNVLELSSFQLESIVEFRAHIGLALNVTQNHLDRHHTFENYAAAKGRLFETQKPGDFAVLNADDPTCAGYAGRTAATVLWFSSRQKVTPGASLCNGKLVLDGKLLMEAAEIPIRGRHNVENVLAAAIAASRAGVQAPAIAAAVRTFRAVEHRLEFVRNVSGIDFYNDSKATSVDATLKALDAFSGGVWLILGGKDKGLDYAALRGPLAAKAHAVLLIGAAAGKISDQLQGSVPLLDVHTLEAAIGHAYKHGQPGDTVLLAPACASFDQFRSYEHRGEVFKQIVNQLQVKD